MSIQAQQQEHFQKFWALCVLVEQFLKVLNNFLQNFTASCLLTINQIFFYGQQTGRNHVLF